MVYQLLCPYDINILIVSGHFNTLYVGFYGGYNINIDSPFILIKFNGENHYELLVCNNNRRLKFKDLPQNIKNALDSSSSSSSAAATTFMDKSYVMQKPNDTATSSLSSSPMQESDTTDMKKDEDSVICDELIDFFKKNTDNIKGINITKDGINYNSVGQNDISNRAAKQFLNLVDNDYKEIAFSLSPKQIIQPYSKFNGMVIHEIKTSSQVWLNEKYNEYMDCLLKASGLKSNKTKNRSKLISLKRRKITNKYAKKRKITNKYAKRRKLITNKKRRKLITNKPKQKPKQNPNPNKTHKNKKQYNSHRVKQRRRSKSNFS